MDERDGDKGSLNMLASEWGMDVVWRLKIGKGDECVMVLRGMRSKIVCYDGFGSERIGIEGVGSDEVGSEVVGCWDLYFSLEAIVRVVGGVDDVVTVVESVRVVKGVMRKVA